MSTWIGRQSAVVTPSGDLDPAEADALGEALIGAATERSGQVVLDLGATGFFGAAALNSIARCLTAMRGTGGELMIVNASDLIVRLLTVTQLRTVPHLNVAARSAEIKPVRLAHQPASPNSSRRSANRSSESPTTSGLPA